jgi:glycerophosphoryl diester phosphodiesterase
MRHALAEHSFPVTVAHRAGNAISTALAAESAGVDVIEADLWLHRGRLELRHSKTLGPVPIRWDRWMLETTAVPALELGELLRALRPETLVMLDLKGRHPDLPGRLRDELHKEGRGRKFLVCSQNWRMLDELQGDPNISIVRSIGSRRQLLFAWSRLSQVGYDTVSIHMRLLDATTVRRLKQHVSHVITWPVNTSKQLERVEDFGADGVISDNPQLLANIISNRGRSDGVIEIPSGSEMSITREPAR